MDSLSLARPTNIGENMAKKKAEPDQFFPPHVAASDKIDQPPEVTSAAYSRLFRWAAGEFRRIGNDDSDPLIYKSEGTRTVPEGSQVFIGGRMLKPGEQYEERVVVGRKPTVDDLQEKCGRWIMDVHKANLLPPVPELQELVRFHLSPTPKRRKNCPLAFPVHGPFNLFNDLRGGGWSTC
jgi:hypothetical protein